MHSHLIKLLQLLVCICMYIKMYTSLVNTPWNLPPLIFEIVFGLETRFPSIYSILHRSSTSPLAVALAVAVHVNYGDALPMGRRGFAIKPRPTRSDTDRAAGHLLETDEILVWWRRCHHCLLWCNSPYGNFARRNYTRKGKICIDY